MKKLVTLLLAMILLISFSNCQSIKDKTDEIVKKENKKLSQFIGQPVSELKIVMGEANADKEMVHMLKLQKLMVDEFGVTAKNNDKLAGIANISEVLGAGDSAEND